MTTVLINSGENASDAGIFLNPDLKIKSARVLNIDEINKTIRLLTAHIIAAHQINKTNEVLEILHIDQNGKIDPEFIDIYKVLPGGVSVRPAQEMMFQIIEIFSEIISICLKRNPAAKITREEIIAFLYVARGAAERVKGAVVSAADSIQSAVEIARNAENIKIMPDGGIKIA